jgi:hypothetical protein
MGAWCKDSPVTTVVPKGGRGGRHMITYAHLRRPPAAAGNSCVRVVVDTRGETVHAACPTACLHTLLWPTRPAGSGSGAGTLACVWSLILGGDSSGTRSSFSFVVTDNWQQGVTGWSQLHGGWRIAWRRRQGQWRFAFIVLVRACARSSFSFVVDSRAGRGGQGASLQGGCMWRWRRKLSINSPGKLRPPSSGSHHHRAAVSRGSQ